MTLADTLLVLNQQKNLAQIELARPQIPFYDQVNHQTHMPYHFDEDYLHSLIDDLNIPTTELLPLVVEKARLLKESQFTFKKYLEEWSLVLDQKLGKEFESIYYNDRFIFNEDGKYRKEKVLLTLFIESSLRQLEKKWDLTRTDRITSPIFHELLNLIIDGVMPKEAAIELFLSPTPNLAAIAAQLNKRQAFLDANKSYELIKKHSQTISVVEDVTGWLNKAMAVEVAPAFPNFAYLVFGQSSRLLENSIQVSGDNIFKEILLLNGRFFIMMAALIRCRCRLMGLIVRLFG